jgi:hypothetical protein
LRLSVWKENHGTNCLWKYFVLGFSIVYLSLSVFSFEAFIESHNTEKLSYTVGHNQFSDMTLDEFHRYNRLGKYSPGILSPRKSHSVREGEANGATATKFRKRALHSLPESVDWVEKGAIVTVKNQGMSRNADLPRIFVFFFLMSVKLCQRNRHVW